MIDFKEIIDVSDNILLEDETEQIALELKKRSFIDRILISKGAIKKRTHYLAKEICDSSADELHCVVVLMGSIVFFSDLIREINKISNKKIFFYAVRISSYEGDESTGKFNLSLDIKEDISGKDVLLVEDIVDTGNTISNLKKHIESKEPKSVKLCSLLDKPSRRKVDVTIDYLGFKIPDLFVVGYGLDFNQNYRELPYVAVLKEEEYK